MLRRLCDLIGHALLKVPAPHGQLRAFCLCGLTDYVAPAEFFR